MWAWLPPLLAAALHHRPLQLAICSYFGSSCFCAVFFLFILCFCSCFLERSTGFSCFLSTNLDLFNFHSVATLPLCVAASCCGPLPKPVVRASPLPRLLHSMCTCCDASLVRVALHRVAGALAGYSQALGLLASLILVSRHTHARTHTNKSTHTHTHTHTSRIKRHFSRRGEPPPSPPTFRLEVSQHIFYHPDLTVKP